MYQTRVESTLYMCLITKVFGDGTCLIRFRKEEEEDESEGPFELKTECNDDGK
jgi:hypothetical protein